MKKIDWIIIGGYAYAVLSACADQAFPQLFDTVAGVFGAPPGIGHKIFIVAGGLIGLASLVTSRIKTANAQEAVATAIKTPAPTPVKEPAS